MRRTSRPVLAILGATIALSPLTSAAAWNYQSFGPHAISTAAGETPSGAVMGEPLRPYAPKRTAFEWKRQPDERAPLPAGHRVYGFEKPTAFDRSHGHGAPSLEQGYTGATD